MIQKPILRALQSGQWIFSFELILDIRGKMIWELVVCDDSLSLQFTKYFPNNIINSVTLKEPIVFICDGLAVPLLDKIHFVG